MRDKVSLPAMAKRMQTLHLVFGSSEIRVGVGIILAEEWRDLQKKRRCFVMWTNSTLTLVMPVTHKAMTRQK